MRNLSLDVSEKALERRIATIIRQKGGLFLKWTSPGTRGVPDRLAFLPGGRFLIIETKSARGKLRPEQKIIIKKLSDLGFKVYIISGVKQIENEI